MATEVLVKTSSGGHKFIDISSGTVTQSNVEEIDTTERNAITIPAGTTPIIYNSDTSTFQIKIGVTWYDLSTKQYADSLVLGLFDDRGSYDASGNTYPATGGSGTAGAILKGDIWDISVQGVLNSKTVGVGSFVRALVDTPGQTNGNWAITSNSFGYTPENQSNKAIVFTVLNDTLYPTTKAVNDQITARRNENGILYNDVIDSQTDADLLEVDLKSYTLAGATLAVNGSYVEVEATLTTASNANAKTINLYFGGTLIGGIDAVAVNGKTVAIRAQIMRKTAGAQFCVCTITRGTAAAFDEETIKLTSLTKTMADAQIIKITGKNGVASAGDIVSHNFIVKNQTLT